jgi:hypothetical protein
MKQVGIVLLGFITAVMPTVMRLAKSLSAPQRTSGNWKRGHFIPPSTAWKTAVGYLLIGVQRKTTGEQNITG